MASPRGTPWDIDPEVLRRYRAAPDRGVILEALEAVDFPESQRRNVSRQGDSTPALGMCLGMTECYVRGPTLSRAVRERPHLSRLLCELASREIPGFRFTSIQVNKDYAAALHVDKNDAGSSRITALGDYSGGELWVDDGGRRGRVVDLQGRWFSFDGNLPHCVLPFRGRRYSLVYFSRVRGGDVGATPETSTAKLLRGLGFPLPPQMPRVSAYPPAEERMEDGLRRFEQFARDVEERGGGPRHVRVRLHLPSGRAVQASVPGGAPVRLLHEALAGRLALHTPGVQLRAGSLVLLPGDTLAGLAGSEFDTMQAIDITVNSEQAGRPSCGEGRPVDATPEKLQRHARKRKWDACADKHA